MCDFNKYVPYLSVSLPIPPRSFPYDLGKPSSYMKRPDMRVSDLTFIPWSLQPGIYWEWTTMARRLSEPGSFAGLSEKASDGITLGRAFEDQLSHTERCQTLRCQSYDAGLAEKVTLFAEMVAGTGAVSKFRQTSW